MMDMSEKLHNILGGAPMPDDDTVCHCVHCSWHGTIKEAVKHSVESTREEWHMKAGREGYEWDCPKCGFVVYAHYRRVS